MIVCHCFGVSDREIRRCARDGARSLNEVGRACAAGTGCGGCRPEIAGILDSERAREEKSALPMLPILRTG